MKVTVWSKDNCVYCDAAKELLEGRNIQFEERKIGEGYTREQFFESNPGCTTLPQIYIHNTHIGGYEDLLTYIDETSFSGSGDTL